MNKRIKAFISASLVITSALVLQPLVSSSNNILAGEKVQAVTARQIESLNRGLTAVKTSNGVLVSWRLLGTEDYNIGFNVYRDGKKIAGPITNSTNFLDKSGSASSKYYVTTVINGVEQTQSDTVIALSNNYIDVPIQKPANTSLDGVTVTYSANDATVADLDGDGEYEFIVKWDPSNSKDNSQKGYTSNVYIDAYKMNGKRLWRIDLGKNIRAGAHYTQFIAYDLNGDGKAEVAMKTADGTVAGDGSVIGDKSKDYRNSSGYILSGPEYLTLFEGSTGKILNNQEFTPTRGTVKSWGDSYGNRVDRFLAGVAYLDGKTPSLIMCRGYYTRSVISAYKYQNGSLNKQWTFDSNTSGNSAYAAQGAHSLNISDIDNDGYDEIVYGSAAIDHTGKGLYSTKLGHGDALHTGDFDPNHSGLETFMVHEEKGSAAGIELRDAKTGNRLFGKKTGTDVGRGLIANIGPDYYPYILLTTDGCYDSKGNAVTTKAASLSKNFTSYWDGDLYQELLDGTHIDKWNSNTKSIDRLLTGSNVHSNNTTKATPSLSGDILGDFREEVIWPTSDDSALRIYMTPYETNHRLYTLMSDVQYREAIAWQNVGYNQPPHPSYYIGEDMKTPTKPNVYTVGNYAEKKINSSSNTGNTQNSTIPGSTVTLSDGWYYIKNLNAQKYLQVTSNKGKSGQNVEIGTGTGVLGQRWYLTNCGNGYITLKSGLGEFMLDVTAAKNEDGTNIEIYNTNSKDAQKFMLKTSSVNGAYVIATKSSNLTKVLDDYNFSKEDGTNVCQWTYGGGTNQIWVFEKIN
ncbi:rhamnogalacturonan endolyase [Clostridium sp. DSM 8431]|uniref:rhamnogalacturonan lyase family protein n=1 Tax=Clostridium sp. DSM 8431 TaxID=1761781 RepID=UPI0008F04376|nr:RICIN domain-containing protein [Clostridium sp. DSM 8431]SFU55011.1 rhamnogalacturonan endolyase [Clostridium sp. DSM 8431]